MPLATLDNKWRMEGSDWTAEKPHVGKAVFLSEMDQTFYISSDCMLKNK